MSSTDTLYVKADGFTIDKDSLKFKGNVEIVFTKSPEDGLKVTADEFHTPVSKQVYFSLRAEKAPYDFKEDVMFNSSAD